MVTPPRFEELLPHCSDPKLEALRATLIIILESKAEILPAADSPRGRLWQLVNKPDASAAECAEVIALDSSLGMLRAARKQHSWRRPMSRLCADVERLPLADGTVDLILSNFMLPWTHAEETLREFRRVLAPHGLLTFTTLGPDTLKELRAAWAEAGRRFNDAHSRVNLFFDMHDVGDALVRAGFAEPVLDVERYTLKYADVRALALDLKAMGGRNATRGRLKGLTGPRKFRAMQSAYEAFRCDGRLPATYEVVFGQAWTPAAPRARKGTTAEIPMADLRRQLEQRRRPGGAS